MLVSRPTWLVDGLGPFPCVASLSLAASLGLKLYICEIVSPYQLPDAKFMCGCRGVQDSKLVQRRVDRDDGIGIGLEKVLGEETAWKWLCFLERMGQEKEEVLLTCLAGKGAKSPQLGVDES